MVPEEMPDPLSIKTESANAPLDPDATTVSTYVYMVTLKGEVLFGDGCLLFFHSLSFLWLASG